MARRRCNNEHTYGVDSKTGLAVEGLGAALWLQWKIPTRGKNSNQQIFTALTQCKESLGPVLSWYCGATGKENLRPVAQTRKTCRSQAGYQGPGLKWRQDPLGARVQQQMDPTLEQKRRGGGRGEESRGEEERGEEEGRGGEGRAEERFGLFTGSLGTCPGVAQ